MRPKLSSNEVLSPQEQAQILGGENKKVVYRLCSSAYIKAPANQTITFKNEQGVEMTLTISNGVATINTPTETLNLRVSNP